MGIFDYRRNYKPFEYPEVTDFTDAINKSLNSHSKHNLQDIENPYGDGGASKKIVKILETFNLSGIIKKKFYDL